MAEDILLALTGDTNGVRVENKVSGDTAVSSEVIVVNGRIAKSTSGIVGRTKNGVFMNFIVPLGPFRWKPHKNASSFEQALTFCSYFFQNSSLFSFF